MKFQMYTQTGCGKTVDGSCISCGWIASENLFGGQAFENRLKPRCASPFVRRFA
jgi:hypothetical protein